MTQPVDLVIPAAPKDYNKLPYVIPSILKNIDVGTIHIIAPTPNDIKYRQFNVALHNDNDVLPYDRSRLQYRPNWMFQKMLKLFQDVTETDWYLVMDADIIVNRPIPLWTNDKPILYLGRDQYHVPYFRFNQKVLGFGKVYPKSFVSECTLYDKGLIDEMLWHCGLARGDEFWGTVVKLTHKGPEKNDITDCYMSEGEFYGSHVTQMHPDVYEIRQLNTTLSGMYREWTDEEIREAIARSRSDTHLISLHTWDVEP